MKIIKNIFNKEEREQKKSLKNIKKIEKQILKKEKKISKKQKQVEKTRKKLNRKYLERSFFNFLSDKEVAIIFNDSGRIEDRRNITGENDTFTYKNRQYNILRHVGTYILIKRWFMRNIILYMYNKRNPMPFTISTNNDNISFQPHIDSELYKSLMDAEVLKKLNAPKRTLFEGINWKLVIMTGIAVIVAWYMYSTGALG